MRRTARNRHQPVPPTARATDIIHGSIDDILAIQTPATRTETDSFGPIEVAADRYWGAQTERSRQNFRIGHDRMPMAIVHALGIVKLASARNQPRARAARRSAAPAPSSAPRAK